MAQRITAQEAHELWLRMGHDPFLFAQHQEAVRRNSGAVDMVYEVDGNTLRMIPVWELKHEPST